MNKINQKQPPKKWDEMTPQEKKSAKKGLCLFGVIIFLITALAISSGDDSSNKKEQKKTSQEIVYNSEWDSSVKQVEDYLKSTLNDPDSYKPVEWSPVGKTTNPTQFIVRHKYRAKNGFGGIITSNQIFTLDSLGIVIGVFDANN